MLSSKNQMAGKRGGNRRNKYCNGGDHECLPRYNASNVGAMWKIRGKYSNKGHKGLDYSIRRKLPGGRKERILT